MIAVAVALVAGKPLGIVSVSWLMVRLGWCVLPAEVNWRSIMLVGLLAGIGFTMSIFIANLAFVDPGSLGAAKTRCAIRVVDRSRAGVDLGGVEHAQRSVCYQSRFAHLANSGLAIPCSWQADRHSRCGYNLCRVGLCGKTRHTHGFPSQPCVDNVRPYPTCTFTPPPFTLARMASATGVLDRGIAGGARCAGFRLASRRGVRFVQALAGMGTLVTSSHHSAGFRGPGLSDATMV